MSAERAKQLFGINWELIIEQSTTAIRDKFEERMLIYKISSNELKKVRLL